MYFKRQTFNKEKGLNHSTFVSTLERQKTFPKCAKGRADSKTTRFYILGPTSTGIFGGVFCPFGIFSPSFNPGVVVDHLIVFLEWTKLLLQISSPHSCSSSKERDASASFSDVLHLPPTRQSHISYAMKPVLPPHIPIR